LRKVALEAETTGRRRIANERIIDQDSLRNQIVRGKKEEGSLGWRDLGQEEAKKEKTQGVGLRPMISQFKSHAI
jgi:hypothetical protein